MVIRSRVVLGLSSHTPVAVVFETDSRIQCVALEPWFLPSLLDALASLWSNFDHWTHQSPSRTARFYFQNNGRADRYPDPRWLEDEQSGVPSV